jgi:outer membrane protein assembly factor BamB
VRAPARDYTERQLRRPFDDTPIMSPRSRAFQPFLLRVLLGLTMLATVRPAAAWMVRTNPSYRVFAAAPDGSVFDAGRKLSKPAPGIAIEKRGPDGGRRWRRRFRDLSRFRYDRISDIEVAANGDVVAAGAWNDADTRWLVLRLGGSDGELRWRHLLPGSGTPSSNHRANSLAVTPGGDVVVAGLLARSPDPALDAFAVFALAGDDGRERWRYLLQIDAPSALRGAEFVDVDAAGDVIAGGSMLLALTEPEWSFGYAIVKLDGTTGTERWRAVLDREPYGTVAALTAAGDVVLGSGRYDTNDMHVALLEGDSGALRWSHRVVGEGLRRGDVFSVLGLPDGDVVVAGRLVDRDGIGQFSVARLAGSDGAERWRRQLPSGDGEGGDAGANALALAPDGRLIVGGWTSQPKRCSDITIAALSPSDGAVRRIRRIDGKTQATRCSEWACEERCEMLGRGIDKDRLWDLELDGSGRVVFVGQVSDGRRGQERGLIGSILLE